MPLTQFYGNYKQIVKPDFLLLYLVDKGNCRVIMYMKLL